MQCSGGVLTQNQSLRVRPHRPYFLGGAFRELFAPPNGSRSGGHVWLWCLSHAKIGGTVVSRLACFLVYKRYCNLHSCTSTSTFDFYLLVTMPDNFDQQSDTSNTLATLKRRIAALEQENQGLREVQQQPQRYGSITFFLLLIIPHSL